MYAYMVAKVELSEKLTFFKWSELCFGSSVDHMAPGRNLNVMDGGIA